MAEIGAILTLHKSGHSQRAIADLLEVDRGTVAKYLAQGAPENRPNAPAGNEAFAAGLTGAVFQNPPNAPTGSERGDGPGPTSGEGPQPETALGSGPPSECEPFRQEILAKVEQGLSAVRIHQDLVEDHRDGAPSYYSVRRFVARLMRKTPLPFRRMETEPGEEAQVDFGTAAPVVDAQGKRRRPWMFRIVLSYSRKGYSEAVWRQSTEAFVQCLENAFRHFGGVPKRLVIDNLKAAVARADWYDPEVHPKLQSFAQHYGTVFLPTKPYTPRHSGTELRGLSSADHSPVA
jgi:transposase